MSKKQSKIKASYEVTPASQKGQAELELPEEATNELGLATARFIDAFNHSSKKVFDMFCNGLSKLGQPIGEILNGTTAAIEIANQSIYMKLAMTKETNMRKMLAYSVSEFDKKVNNGEDIPEHIVETDEISLIEENASLTSNEEFLQLWAKLYTEEVCKPGSISRKTIKLVETLDIKIIKILENEILPFCDKNGFFWGSINGISNLLLMQGYGLIEANAISASNSTINSMYEVRLNNNYTLYCYPNLSCSAVLKTQMYRLTKSALEIVQNIDLQILSSDNIDNVIFNHIEESSRTWKLAPIHKDKIKLKNTINPNEKFIVCDNNSNVVFPLNSQFKNVDEFYQNAIQNIEVKNNDE